MSDLFTTTPKKPLAELLRPTKLTEVVGQNHLLGPGKPLRLVFESKKLHSMIFWGPPGTGKTTLARMVARVGDCEFINISAVLDGVKEIRAALARAQDVLDRSGRQTVIFVDEVHRFNKGQQDALLPSVESGLVVLLSATTENVAFEVNSALVSRTQVYRLQPLVADDFRRLFERAKQTTGVDFEPAALDLAIQLADGDARRFLGVVEQLTTAAEVAGVKVLTHGMAKESASESIRRFDKGADEAYEQISAFQKCIRGSNPNAALYWLARMLDGGADPRYIARRLIVIASEDVGNADPRALQLALNASEAYERLGSPEGDRALAQAATFLALAPKSNAVYTGWNEARAFVRDDGTRPVPMHLRNAPTKLQAELGYKKGYRYAHDEPDAYAAGESYFPDGMPEPNWYRPVPRGLEVKLSEKLERLHALDAEARAKGLPKR